MAQKRYASINQSAEYRYYTPHWTQVQT